ncbi:MAG: SDR family NAD(P)-dependent oxidoreductase [Pseudomonadales bacterium]|nr:SDR family NAD(P)-dependent oxidoreductase [Pseudomonadales bacterium]
MKNKTALITGGTEGVGLSIVRALAKANYNVYFIGRNTEKGAQIESELKEQFDAEFGFIELDLSDLVAVKQCTQDFLTQHEQLDLLANVAGVILSQREETRYGLEKTFSVGFLSAYILATELSPLLEKSQNPRILFVSGSASIVLKKKLDFNNLNLWENYNGFRAAANTVHAKTVLAEILSEKYLNYGIDVNAFHPGVVKSQLGRGMAWPLNVITKGVSNLLPRDTKTGINACLSDTLNGVTGQFLYGNKRLPLNFDKQYKERLWQETETLVNEALSFEG